MHRKKRNSQRIRRWPKREESGQSQRALGGGYPDCAEDIGAPCAARAAFIGRRVLQIQPLRGLP